MGKSQHTICSIVYVLLAYAALHGQTVISDSTYNDADWGVTVVTTFDASETHAQRLTGGNPDAYRYMEHILPAPPGPEDLTRVEVTHIYNDDAYLTLDSIDHIDYAEDIRLLSVPWDMAFIRSFPAIRQDGKLFRATSQYLTVIADTMWTSGTLTGLKANDFVALDGSDDKPDFSDQGAFLYFGFWRVSARGATLPPIPPDEDLIYQHGSDNFTVTIHDTPLPNQPPVARADEYLYLDYFFNSDKTLPVLQNDSDPEGDPIRISNIDEPAFGGTIESFTDSTITYSHEGLLFETLESDFFLYRITDGLQESIDAFVTMYFCVCPLECLQLFLPSHPIAQHQNTHEHGAVRSATDSLDIDLFRRFRDEVLLPDETGAGFVDLYYHFAPEVMPLFVIHRPRLGRQAFNALGLMQGPISNLLDGDGSAMITQELVDSVNIFIDSLMAAASDSLRDALETELVQLCPLQDLVGLTVSQAMQNAICDTMVSVEDVWNNDLHRVMLQQNFPNPFFVGTSSNTMNPSTRISYILSQAEQVQLIIYDVHGRQIKILVDTFQPPGEQSITWDGKDDHGNLMPPGLYFYQLSTTRIRETKEMLLLH